MILYRKFICTACGHEWELPQTLKKNYENCPACGREKVHRIDAGLRREGLDASDREVLTMEQVQV